MEPAERPSNETADESTQPMKESYFAEVDAPSEEGADAIVTVRLDDGERLSVPRSRLRHRKWHRIAFFGITPEKRHDGVSSQAFLSRIQAYFQVWNDSGRKAANAWALYNPTRVVTRVKAVTRLVQTSSAPSSASLVAGY